MGAPWQVRGWLGGAALLGALGLGCGDDAVPPGPPPPTDPATLLTTLEDLAALGEKKVGTPAGAAAGQYVRDRMVEIGLADVHLEPFRFPRHDTIASSLRITAGGADVVAGLGHDVLGGSGGGHVAGRVVWAGTATDDELASIPVAGQIALVRRSVTFHRSSQYVNLSERGALAMIYVSTAADNLRQVGTTGRDFEPVGPIPALSIGGEDGEQVRLAIMAGQDVRAELEIEVAVTPATGNNVVGRIEGREGARGQILIGAHYDTWFTGSTDNGGGVAALLALAARRVAQGRPRYTLVFVGYDGEEVALYGGYHHLRRHHVVGREPILAVLNFEVPSARDTSLLGLGRSFEPILDDALRGGGLNFLYPLYITMNVVPELFGGIIPTDIQGMYRANLATISTASDTPYYHTIADTPDKVDVEALAEAVDGFDQALGIALAAEPEAFAGHDPALWRAEVEVAARGPGEPLLLQAALTDAAGTPQAGAPATATLFRDDFFIAGQLATAAGDDGVARFGFGAPGGAAGAAFVHVTAGPDYPLVEAIVAVQP